MAYEALTNPKFKTIKITPPKKQTASHKTAAEIRREEIKKRREELRKEALKRAKIRRSKIILNQRLNTIESKYIGITVTLIFQILFLIPTNIGIYSYLESMEENTIEYVKYYKPNVIAFTAFLTLNIFLIFLYFVIFTSIKRSKKLLKQT